MNRRIIFRALGIAATVALLVSGGVIAYLKSSTFDARARRLIVQEIQRRTGATVTLGDFDWSFWNQRIRLDDLTLHGLEPSEEAPLAHFSRIDIGLNFRTLIRRRIDLFELTFTRPEFHIRVTPDGRTSIPSPERGNGSTSADLQISVRNFNVLAGSAILNEQRIPLDLSLTNLAAILNYYPARQVLETHLSYDGVLDRSPGVRLSIPYGISADMDYTRGTIVAHRIDLTSSGNQLRLQGKVNQVLSKKISGNLEYSGSVSAPFLNYFFTAEAFAGKAAVAGVLECSNGYFFTQGHATSDAIAVEGWQAAQSSADYVYRYPARKLSLTKFATQLTGGSVTGEVEVENLPGPSRVNLDLDYSDIDTAQLVRAYPWDPRYRILSYASGTLNGWFEGKIQRFDFSGQVMLKSAAAPAAAGDTVLLPLDGSIAYEVRPEETRVPNADLRFYSSAVKAEGVISAEKSDLKVNLASSNLKDLAFIYPDANGTGSFVGSLSGEIAKPSLEGAFTLQGYEYRQWKIEQAGGNVRLQMQSGTAAFKDVRVWQGQSQVVINGTAALSGSPIDLRLQSNGLAAQDLRSLVGRDIGGILSGDAHLTSISPTVKLEGDLSAAGLSLDKHLIGNARGHIRYFDPDIDIQQLSIQQNGSTLTGSVSLNRTTNALKFDARMNSINLETFQGMGLPESVQGLVRQADFRGDGTISDPNVQGHATLQNLSVNGEMFPAARVEISSKGPKVAIGLNAGPNINLQAEVDTATSGYPFTARANFTQYPIERVAQFSQGRIGATGNATLAGLLTDPDRMRGEGRIENADIQVRQMALRSTKPFAFSFNPDELTLTAVTLTGPSTDVSVAGKIGLRESAALNLGITGQLNLALFSGGYPGLLAGGIVNARIDVGGTVQAPDFRGTAALENASLSRIGFFTSLTNLNGSLLFNQDQIRLSDVEGQMGGGTVRVQGTALLQAGTIRGLNIEIDAANVRMRGYPEGLRTVVNSKMTLKGDLVSPLLEGNVQIESLAYRSSFEEFLTLLAEENLKAAPSPLGRLRLAMHVEGGKNITIQNQLADVEARVDIDWKGTVDEPAITGHIEASGGNLLFQGNRYTVTRGNIDFVDPLSIQPVIDIEAESQVRDYRVILSITGRGNNPKLTMRSDPPLPELEIVSLIAGGRTREEIASRTGSAPTSERLFQSGAASILFDLLQQRVGNRLGLLGGGRVRIDPYSVGAENNPGTRITLSEQVTKDITITYSQDLSSNRQQVVVIEYFVGRNTSIVASRDELGNLGLDLRHRTRIK